MGVQPHTCSEARRFPLDLGFSAEGSLPVALCAGRAGALGRAASRAASGYSSQERVCATGLEATVAAKGQASAAGFLLVPTAAPQPQEQTPRCTPAP